MLKIVLLGGGNLAQHLFTQFSKNPTVELIQWYNRSIAPIGQFEHQTQITTELKDLKEADLYILAVSDSAIREVSKALPFKDKLVAHTSGNTEISAIDSKNRSAVFYPLQSFRKENQVQWSEIPLLLEASNEKDFELLHLLAKGMSDKVYSINSKQRSSIHLIAVFLNNFVNHLYTIGNQISKQEQIPFEVFLPLIKRTTASLENSSPLDSQTGPALRADHKTIASHLQQLKNPLHKEIYKSITSSIIETHGREKL